MSAVCSAGSWFLSPLGKCHFYNKSWKGLGKQGAEFCRSYSSTLTKPKSSYLPAPKFNDAGELRTVPP